MKPGQAVRPRFASDALLANAEPWTGAVVRRLPEDYRRRSEVIPWRCRNLGCGHWTPAGSRAAGMCLLCYTPRPDDV